MHVIPGRQVRVWRDHDPPFKASRCAQSGPSIMLQTLKRLLHKVHCYSCRLRLVLSVQLARVTNMGADTKTPNLRLQRLSISHPERGTIISSLSQILAVPQSKRKDFGMYNLNVCSVETKWEKLLRRKGGGQISGLIEVERCSLVR